MHQGQDDPRATIAPATFRSYLSTRILPHLSFESRDASIVPRLQQLLKPLLLPQPASILGSSNSSFRGSLGLCILLRTFFWAITRLLLGNLNLIHILPTPLLLHLLASRSSQEKN